MHCVATHSSDLAVALAALDAAVIVRGRMAQRSIPFADFHRLPGETPERDTVLERGDLIVAIDVPARQEARASHYLKLRDRASYEFALVRRQRRSRPTAGTYPLSAAGAGRRGAQALAAQRPPKRARGVSLDDIETLEVGDRRVLHRGSATRPQRLQGRARRSASPCARCRRQEHAYERHWTSALPCSTDG